MRIDVVVMLATILLPLGSSFKLRHGRRANLFFLGSWEFSQNDEFFDLIPLQKPRYHWRVHLRSCEQGQLLVSFRIYRNSTAQNPIPKSILSQNSKKCLHVNCLALNSADIANNMNQNIFTSSEEIYFSLSFLSSVKDIWVAVLGLLEFSGLLIPSLASLSKKSLHNSARLSLLVVLSNCVLRDGVLGVLRKGEAGTLNAILDAPGRANPACSFCSSKAISLMSICREGEEKGTIIPA